MSLSLSTLGITNSIVDLQNQIDDLDVDVSDKQDTITTSTTLDGFKIIALGEIKFYDPTNTETDRALRYETFVNIDEQFSTLTSDKQDLITEDTEIETLNITSNINLIDNIDPNNYAVLSYNTFNNKQDLITQGTTLNGFNIAGSSSINFFNPSNQLDAKQLNFTTLETIDTNFENIATGKQDILNNTSNIVVKSLLVTTDNIITTPLPGNIECDDIIVGGQTLAEIIAASGGGTIVRFKAFYRGGFTQISSINYPYNTVAYNIGGGTYDTTNYTYTIPISGLYFFTFSYMTNAATSQVELQKDGVIQLRSNNSINLGTYTTRTCVCYVNCNVGEVMKVFIRQGTLRGGDVGSAPNGLIHFTGILIT